MGWLTVDEASCRQDGICVAECPRRIIAMEQGGFPLVATERERFCMHCGHCVAVCPHGAVSVAEFPREACPVIDDTPGLGWEPVVQFLRSRRSIRVYGEREVERPTLQKLIETARYAPTASNSQTVHWTVVSGREKLTQLSELTIDWMRGVVAAQPATAAAASMFRPLVTAWDGGTDPILRNAPILVVASAPKEASNGLVDCTIALTTLELAALPLSLGTCWAGLLQAALLNAAGAREAVGLPTGHTAHYPMMVGYPKFAYHRLPERQEPSITWK
ncbi:MAG: nitroreductase family protein [Deferrisomatales bacterium]|nr:nitroreductase family protein [Deferrisomatales bacterium]